MKKIIGKIWVWVGNERIVLVGIFSHNLGMVFLYFWIFSPASNPRSGEAALRVAFAGTAQEVLRASIK